MFLFLFFLLYLFVLNRFPPPFFLCPSTCKHREDIGKTCTAHPSLAGLRRDLWIIHRQKIGQPREPAWQPRAGVWVSLSLESFSQSWPPPLPCRRPPLL